MCCDLCYICLLVRAYVYMYVCLCASCVCVCVYVCTYQMRAHLKELSFFFWGGETFTNNSLAFSSSLSVRQWRVKDHPKNAGNFLLTHSTSATFLREISQPLFWALNGESAEVSGAHLLFEVHNILCATQIISSNWHAQRVGHVLLLNRWTKFHREFCNIRLGVKNWSRRMLIRFVWLGIC